MPESKVGVVNAGARLVWRRQRVLWCLYAINLLLALIATVPGASRVGNVLDRSLAAERLYRGFDLMVFAELASQPEVSLSAQFAGSFFSALLFFVFMLFMTGGILEVYRRGETLAAAVFFQACGAFFWRFVRLLVFLLIVLAPIAVLFGRVPRWFGRLSSDAPQEMLGFWVLVGGVAVVLFLLTAVRLWFDMAQVLTVAENERRMRCAVIRAFRLTFGNLGSLLWMCFRILVVAVAGLVLVFWVWIAFVPAHWVAASFLLGQAAVFLWLAARLWLRASETLWYQRHQRVPAVISPEAPAPPSTEGGAVSV